MEEEVGLESTEKLRLRKKKWMMTSLCDVLRAVGAKMEWQVAPEDRGEMVK